jgi:HSP20 family protein
MYTRRLINLNNFFSNIEKDGKNLFNDFVNEFSTIINNNRAGSTNVEETDNSFIIEMNVVGFDKEKISINIENDTLSVKGNNDESDTTKKFNRFEFEKNNFERNFILPDNIDHDNISADVKNGILTLTLNKKEPNKAISKTITIN